MNNKKTYLLDIAEELFCRYGSKGTTMRLITREAGTNTAMLNYYFRSKENLFITVLERRIKKLKKDIKILSPESNEIIEQLLGYTNVYIDLITENLPFYRLMMKEKLLNENPGAVNLIDAYFNSMMKTLKTIIYNGILQSKICIKDTEVFIMNVSGILMYAIFKSDDKHFPFNDVNIMKLKNHMEKMLLDSIVDGKP